MGLSDYFGRFWFAAEPIFGVVMTLCFLGILRNPIIEELPPALQDPIVMGVVGAAISCCIAWGVVDGIFYAWENHSIAARKTLTIAYAKDQKQRGESLSMVEEDLGDTYVDLLSDDEKKSIYDSVVTNLAKVETKQKVPLKDDIMTIFLDFCLNTGACLAIILPLYFLYRSVALATLVNIAVIIAIVLLFFIGLWVEHRKSPWLKVRKGIMYAILGIIITILTWLLGG